MLHTRTGLVLQVGHAEKFPPSGPCGEVSSKWAMQRSFLQVGHAEKFPPSGPCGEVSSKWAMRRSCLRHFISKAWIFSSVSEQGPCFSAIEEDGGDKRPVQLDLACEADGLALPDPVKFGHCCHC